MKRFLIYILPIALCFAVGYSASVMQEVSLAEWYPYLTKTPGTPPGIVFPIVWSIMYLLAGIAAGVLTEKKFNEGIRLWACQIILNFMWSFTFFYMRSPISGFINILLLDIVLAYLIYISLKHVRLVAYLLLPYLLWLVYATYLNLGIIILN